MSVDVKLFGHKHLPDAIDPERLADGASIVGRMLGIDGTVEIHIRPRQSKTMGQTNPQPNDTGIIWLWPWAIASEVKTSQRWTVRRLWAWTLAHELVHLSQLAQWNEIGKRIREDWAEALEPVFGPIIENELGRGPR